MTDTAHWFHSQLEQTGTLFVWALEQVSVERREVAPPGRDEWMAARHAFHMVYYEREIALPSMRQWIGGAMPNPDTLDEDAAWIADTEGHKWNDMIAAFRRGRAEQIALLGRVELGESSRRRGTSRAGTRSGIAGRRTMG